MVSFWKGKITLHTRFFVHRFQQILLAYMSLSEEYCIYKHVRDSIMSLGQPRGQSGQEPIHFQKMRAEFSLQ